MKTFYDLMKLNVCSSMCVFFHLISIQAFGHLDPCRRVWSTLLFPKSLHPPSSCENVNAYRSPAPMNSTTTTRKTKTKGPATNRQTWRGRNDSKVTGLGKGWTYKVHPPFLIFYCCFTNGVSIQSAAHSSPPATHTMRCVFLVQRLSTPPFMWCAWADCEVVKAHTLTTATRNQDSGDASS